MNKRITSIVLSFVMLFTMLATAVPALAAAPVQLKVTADTTSANPGDTINYTVSIGAVTNMGGLEFKLDIPSGLTIVDSSISIPTGLETTIDSDGAIVIPSSKNGYKWSYSAQSAGYTGASDLEILSFACTVDNGASGNKNVTIKVATFFDNDELNEFEYEVTNSVVTVTAAPKPATDISLNKDELTLTAGATETLTATVTPSDTTDTVAWSSNKPEVATVDSTGKVTAVAPGEATITAKAGEQSASCAVTVNEATPTPVPVASIELNKTALTLEVGK
ncbi:Ig-like domain-containing protein, partial [Intestinimonas butyriciproducens]|uniref:Ig-like domain-containing protein n=1 Tax=Intestinimonas butyriciproducens TaxID=1297617 RepID=UPI001C11D9F4